jgi:hypothetical protein
MTTLGDIIAGLEHERMRAATATGHATTVARRTKALHAEIQMARTARAGLIEDVHRTIVDAQRGRVQAQQVRAMARHTPQPPAGR